MDPAANMSSTERTQALLEESLELQRRIYESTERTRKYIVWGQVLGVIKILVIVVPLIWGVVLLKPYLQTALGAYGELLGTPSQNSGNGGLLQQLKNSGIDAEDLQQYLK